MWVGGYLWFDRDDANPPNLELLPQLFMTERECACAVAQLLCKKNFLFERDLWGKDYSGMECVRPEDWERVCSAWVAGDEGNVHEKYGVVSYPQARYALGTFLTSKQMLMWLCEWYGRSDFNDIECGARHWRCVVHEVHA